MNITLGTIKEAYRQLKRHLYYERLDLDARHRIVLFEDKYNYAIEKRLKTIESWIKKDSIGEGIGGPVKQLIKQVDINIFVKKICKENDENTANFITDRIHTNNFNLERENTFASIPIELQILGTLWLNTVGAKVDKKLINHCYGNRLIQRGKNQDLQLNGRLFKIYHFQYARWWKTGLAKAKSILRKDKEDVVMLNFDVKSFYHSVCLDKDTLRSRVNYKDLCEQEKYLHRVLESVLEKYNDKLKEYQVQKNKKGWA